MKNKEEQIIKIKHTDYKINISKKENMIRFEIYPSKNKKIYYYQDFSLKELKNNNNILKSCQKIQDIFDCLKNITTQKNSKYNIIKIEENEKYIKLIIMNGKENITILINKEDDEPEKKDDSIFNNNLNNFENTLNEIENDICNLNPFLEKLIDENEKLTEENKKLNNQINELKEENQKLNQIINDFKNSKNNLINTEKENNNNENINKEKIIQDTKNENRKLNQENYNSNSKNQKNQSENKAKKNENIKNNNSNSNNQKIGNENKIKNTGNKNQKIFNKSISLNNNIKYIFSKDLENKIINYIKESESYKNNIISFDLLYKATIDNDSASSFHKKVDNKGPIIVIVKLDDDRIIGGFSSKSWSSKNNYIEDNEAFLFNNFYKYTPNEKEKNYTCCHIATDGPHFGKYALVISNNCLYNENNICGKDTYTFKYFNLIGKKGRSQFKIKDYEVYKVDFKD